MRLIIIILSLLFGVSIIPHQVQEESGPMQPEEVVEIDLGEGHSAIEVRP